MSGVTGEGVKEALRALVEVIGEAPVSAKAKGAAQAEPWAPDDAAGLIVLGLLRHFQIMELARIAFTEHRIVRQRHGPPRFKKIPPHRRQGRLVAADRFRRGRGAGARGSRRSPPIWQSCMARAANS